MLVEEATGGSYESHTVLWLLYRSHIELILIFFSYIWRVLCLCFRELNICLRELNICSSYCYFMVLFYISVVPMFLHKALLHILPIHSYLVRFLSFARSKLRLCLANQRRGYSSNLAWDRLSIAWAYSEQQTGNGHWSGWMMCFFPHFVVALHVA